MAKKTCGFLFALAVGWVWQGGFLAQGATEVILAPGAATVRIKKADGQTAEKAQQLEKTGPNVYRLRIPIGEIARDTETIDVVFDSATAKKGEEGYFVVSTGVLGTFREEKGKLEERRNPMPIFGMKNSRGAFVGIVKGLKYEFKTVVDVTNGVYTIFPRFLIKEMAFDPYEDLVVDFCALEGSDANYSGMARAYRQYQLDRGEVKPLRERVKDNPQLAYTADTMFVRVAHGSKNNKDKIENQTLTNEPPLHVGHTFDDLIRIMRDIKTLGVEKAEICCVGWNLRGHDGRYPTLFPVEPAFGGEAKLREAIACAHDLGYQIVCHCNNTDFYTISDRYDENDIARRPDGSLLKGGFWAGGRAYSACFQRVNDAYVDDDYRKLTELGFRGTFHIDVTSCITPYPCFDPKHPCNRQQTADYMNKIGEKAHRAFGGFGSEGPCDHVAKTLDFALYASAYPMFMPRTNPLIDRLIPLWQLAYHGIILSNPFYKTIDHPFECGKKTSGKLTFEERQTLGLKVVEFGGRPVFYHCSYQDLSPIKAAYDEYQPLKYLQYEFMEAHDELATDVFRTTYYDGSEVVCNYSDNDYVYRGNAVKALGYKLVKPAFMRRALRSCGIY
jgi:hypothetical protein